MNWPRVTTQGLTLKTRILLITLLPTLVVALVVGGYLLATRVADLRQSQQQIGENIVRHLAPASEFAVLSGDETVLNQLASRLVEDPGVYRVSIRDAKGRVLTDARSPGGNTAREAGTLAQLYPVSTDDLTFAAPIRLGEKSGGEFESLFTDSDRPERESVLGSVEVQLSPLPLLERQTVVLRFGVLLILGGMILAWIIALQASLSILRPINRVIGGLRRFREGDLDARVPVRSQGEAGLLERGFNDLASEVQASRERMEAQIEQATSELRETLEAVEIKNVELDLARKRAEESNRLKSDFLANISHEIRTPMNAIFGYTQLLARTDLQESQKDYIATIQHSADSLLALLEDVLNLSRIEAGKIDVEESTFEPLTLIEDTISMMAPTIFERGLDLVWHPLPELPESAVADAVKIRQILGNLLSNAAKFTDRGHILVEAGLLREDGDSHLHIDVVDTGIGIAPSDTNRLFRAFSQLDSTSARRHQGAGLGLVICQQLAGLMGGRIEVDSIPGNGSRFRAVIPVQVVRSAGHQPLAGDRAHVVSRHDATRQALASRLAQWGCAVASHARPERETPIDAKSDSASEGRQFLVICLSGGDLDDSDYLDRLRSTFQSRPITLVLAATLDRMRLQKLEDRFACPCLPGSISSRGLLTVLARPYRPEQARERHEGSLLPASHRLDNLRVLIVEDNRINRRLTTEFLENAGAQVHAAVDGNSALALASDYQCDVVLMDIQLPGMDGLETASRLRELPGYDARPIIALTASASDEERHRCEQAGLNDVLVKPIREEILLERILRVATPGTEAGAPPPPSGQAGDGKSAPPRTMGRDDDGNLKPEIAEMVLSDLPGQLDAARAHFDEADLQALDAEVHRIRGTAAFCGFRELAATCEAIRAAIETGPAHDDALSDHVRALSREITAIIEDLQHRS